jgi:hypothetical protein
MVFVYMPATNGKRKLKMPNAQRAVMQREKKRSETMKDKNLY